MENLVQIKIDNFQLDTGKLELINKIVPKDEFKYNKIATLGIAYFNINIKLGNKVIQLKLWYIHGNDGILSTSFFRNPSFTSWSIFVYAIDE